MSINYKFYIFKNLLLSFLLICNIMYTIFTILNITVIFGLLIKEWNLLKTAIIIFFCYNFFIFKYASKILVKFTKRLSIYLLICTLNTISMLKAYEMNMPYSIAYFCVLITLTLEFLAFSKAPFRQAFLCSSIITINICTIQQLVLPLYAYMLNLKPYQIFKNENLFFKSLSLVFIILLVVFYISSKFISKKSIIKLSTTNPYAFMISSFVVFILFYTCIDVYILNSKAYDFYYLPTYIATPILSFTNFYSLFFFSIKSINMFSFKRKSDELEIIKQQKILIRKNIEDKLSRDDLTKCYNRKYIMSYLEEKQSKNEYGFAILFIDIDNLKIVNDTLGHEYGDEYIKNVSHIILESIREYDLLSRLGGDEFLLILNNIDNESNIELVLKRINGKINFLNKVTPKYNVSASIGYIFVTEDLLKSSIDNIVKLADDKMRIVKKSSKGDKI